MYTNIKKLSAFILFCLLMLMQVSASAADSRITALTKMLTESGNYRVRVQAARTLGRLRKPEAVPALIAALKDENELVVVTAASALGHIGDKRALDHLKKLGSHADPAVKSQSEAAIRQIESILKRTGKMETASIETMDGLRAILSIGQMGDATGGDSAALKEFLQDALSREVSQTPGYAVIPAGTSKKKILSLSDEKKVSAYILQGSVTKLGVEAGYLNAAVSLILLSNPGNDIRAMITGKARVPWPSGGASDQVRKNLEKSAVTAAAKGGFQGLARHLESRRLKGDLFEGRR